MSSPHNARETRPDPFRTMVNESVDGILVVDVDGIVQYANPAAVAIFGELEGAQFGVPAADRPTEMAVPTADGVRHVELRASEIRWDGRTARLTVARDVTDRHGDRLRVEHLNRALRAIRDVNQLITREPDRAALVQQACDILVGSRGYRAAWIATVDDEGTIALAAQAGLDEGTLDQLAEALGRGELPACAWRARAARHAIAVPMAGGDCDNCPVRILGNAEMMGFAAPLDHGGRCFGWLNVYLPEEVAAPQQDASLVAEIAGDLAFALHTIDLAAARAEAEEAVRRERDFVARVLDTAQAIVLVLDGSGRIVSFNRYMEELSGRHLAEVQGQDWFETFVIPEDRDRVRGLFASATAGTPTRGAVTGILTRDGRTRLIEWYDNPLLDEDGAQVGLLSIGHDVTERLAAERERDQTAARLAAAVKAGDVGLWDYYPQENRAEFSDEWKRQLGCAPDEIASSADEWSSGLHPDDRDRVLSILTAYIASGGQGNYAVEFRLRHRDGSYRWILARGAAVAWEGGTVTRMLGCHVDITERKRMEEELEHNRELLDETGQMARVGGWEIDLTSNTVVWTPVTRMIHEVPDDYVPTLEEAIGFFPEAVEELTEAIRRAREEGVGFDLDLPFVTAKGHKLWTHAFGKPEFRDGRCVRLHGTFRDITEHKEAEDRVASMARFPAENPNPVLRVGADGVIGYANAAAAALLPAIATADGRRLLPDWQRGVAASLASTRAQEAETGVEGRLYLLSLAPVPEQGYVNIYAQDMTEKQELEYQLRQAQKLDSIGRLAGGVAHDFNNLLMAVLGYVDLCRRTVGPDHRISGWLDEISAEANRSVNLTRQLLAFARKQTIAPEVLDLNDVIPTMLKLLRRLIGEDIDLAWMPGLETWRVKLDPSQIDQILANLCVNARDAIAGVGEIAIKTGNACIDAAYCATHPDASPGEFALLTVSDNGCGMDAETIEHMFEPFFTTKEVGKGTGLGLATVYGIVHQNGGFVDVVSTPGEGATFSVYLPRCREESSRDSAADQAPATGGGSETILLVEDEPAVRALVRLFLDKFGYTVIAAATPAEGLRLAGECPDDIHLLVTDVVMPGMNGRDLATTLAAARPHIKCLFMSGYTADIIANRGVLEAGVNFLGKPFTPEGLAQAVRQALDGPTP